MIITNETRAGLFSKETLLNLSKKVCFTSFVSFDRCGRYISTKNMVPINRKELKSPKSLNAIESNDTKAKNAPTVVTLPTKRGIIISCKAFFFLGVCDKWAIKCNG